MYFIAYDEKDSGRKYLVGGNTPTNDAWSATFDPNLVVIYAKKPAERFIKTCHAKYGGRFSMVDVEKYIRKLERREILETQRTLWLKELVSI